jgi:hypothetical protein
MKGKLTVKIELTDETRFFPITETWEYNVDNTYESLDEWLTLFEKILVTQGFSNYKLTVEDG